MRAAGLERPATAARAMYRSLGVSALEFLWMAANGRAALRHVAVDAASLAPWREALGRGRGVVIAGSHTGNWDLAACAVAQQVELLVVTKRLSVQSIDRFWQSTRAGRGVALVTSEGCMARARRMLARGGAVVMMIDQVPPSRHGAVEAPFLGRRAFMDRAPAALAARSGSPLVVAASHRDDGGEHLLHVLGLFDPPAAGKRAWVEEATVASARLLERFVLDHPSQWLWLHRRWRSPPPRRVALHAAHDYTA
jgi:KDO2-lipid IV(A) lauroyltransferase